MVKELFSDFPVWKFIFAVTGLCVALLIIVVTDLHTADSLFRLADVDHSTRLSIVENSRCDANLCATLSSAITLNSEKVNSCKNEIKTIQSGRYREGVERRISKGEERLRVIEKQLAVLDYRKQNEK